MTSTLTGLEIVFQNRFRLNLCLRLDTVFFLKDEEEVSGLKPRVHE